MVQWLSVSLYLGAVVAANFAVAYWGQAALPFTAFVLIPFDLVTRDILHEQWHGNRLWLRMFALILTGSVVSAALSWDVRRVALASALAFFSAGVLDAVVYQLLHHRSRYMRMNVSNAVAAVVDSIVFPLVAFDTVLPWMCATQAGSKFVGGLFWSYLFVRVLLARGWVEKE